MKVFRFELKFFVTLVVVSLLLVNGHVFGQVYSESFESGFGRWSNVGGDELNWTRNTNATPSGGTGPNSASDGNWYLYIESSGSASGYKPAFLEQTFDLSSFTVPVFTFDYHMYGSSIGSLSVDVYDGTSWHNKLLSIVGEQQTSNAADWRQARIDLSDFVGKQNVTLRLNGTSGGNYRGDLAIDNLALHNYSVSNLPDHYSDGFESCFSAGWENVATDDMDWVCNSGGTPSGGTGPDGASEGNNYLYIEASSPNYPSKTALLERVFDFRNIPYPELSFDYHMFGATMGSIHLDVNNGYGWFTDVWSISGQQHSNSGAQWSSADVDLAAFGALHKVTIRFRGISGSSYSSDAAIDNISIKNGVYVEPLVWYSYQSGDWDDWQVWTLDPSGTLLINPQKLKPAVRDFVHVLGGRTVTVYSNNKQVRSVTIHNGGLLNTQATTGHNFTKIDGQGVYKLSSANLDIPASGGTFFMTGGGTVEYSGSGTGSLFSDFEFNNLILNMQNSTDRVTLLDDLVVHGYLTVKNGLFRINDNATANVLDIAVEGALTVAASGGIAVGTANVYHTMSVGGDFNNYGVVRFTNRSAPLVNNYYTSDPTMGGLVFSFKGESDNALNCFNITDFHRFIVDKGSDPTYVLTVNAADQRFFRLFGRRDQAAGSYNTTDENPALIIKPLWIKNGTLKLEGKIHIPSLTEGGSDNFLIPLNGALWLNSPDVQVDVTVAGYNGTGNQAIIPIGNVIVDDGVLDCGDGAGIVFRGTSQFIVNGGYVRASQYRPSSFAVNCVSAFIQNGGLVDIDGFGEMNGQKQSFCLPFSDNSFSMSGGRLNIKTATESGAFLLGCNEENADVSGGEINFVMTGTRNDDFTVNSRVALYDVNISKESGSVSTVRLNTLNAGGFMWPVADVNVPLSGITIKNNLNIITGQAAVFDANNADVIVGGDFVIQSNCAYEPGLNTTVFNGGDLQAFVVDGTISSDLHKLSIINKSDLMVKNNDITISSDFFIEEGAVFRDGGRIIHVKGDVENNGTHYKPVSGAGSIRFDGDGNQLIKGNGKGVFNNITIDQSSAGASVALNCDARLTGNLRLAGIGNDAVPAHLNIGNHELVLEKDADIYTGIAGTATDFGHNRMVLASGDMSGGGIKKQLASAGGFLFPFGFENAGSYYYMPASISFLSDPADFGYVTSRPVNKMHPLLSSADALSCYWKTQAEGFVGIVPNSVIHKYYYDNELSDDFVNGNESLYLSSVYRGGTDWEYINSSVKVNPATNELKFDNDSEISGDYTAGEVSAFDPIPVLYSVADGNWNDPATWSDTRGGTNHPGVPVANSVVNVCDNHKVTIFEDGKTVGGLSIEEGATLDLQATTGHNFTILSDNLESKGTMRISGGYFPQGDLGFILGENGGTIEYYTIASDFTLPSFSDVTNMSLTHYNNLKLTHSDAYTIILPGNDLRIYDDLTVNGSGSKRVSSNTSADYAIVVDSNFVIETGKFRYETGSKLDITVMNDVVLAAGADMRVRNSATGNNSLTIYGSLQNDGNIMFDNTGHVDLYFKGNTDESIDGSGVNAFYTMTVDKGTDYSPVLTVNQNFSSAFDPAISLLNGTFRWNVHNTLFDLTTDTEFVVRSSACLSVQDGFLRTNAGNNDYGLNLQGKLEVIGGDLFIGNATNSAHNDIQYSAAGTPEIYIESGLLSVNGLIRRTVLNTMGALKYTQKGGETVIYGKNQLVDQQVTRAAFEIANNGSEFNMSGGKLVISRTASGTNFGDLYLRPAQSLVTGGAIEIVGAMDYLIDADCSLNNLYIGNGADASNVRVWVNDLDVNGNLEIRAASTLNSGTQSVDVFVAGDFMNKGAFTSNENTFVFDGDGYQQATFNTNTDFYGLTVDKTAGAVTLSGTAQPSVMKKLTLENGILDDGGRTLTLYGDLTNNAVHLSAASGSIYLTNPISPQYVDGDDSGQFGNLIIDNPNNVVFMDDMAVNQVLTFVNGKLDIGRELLTFGANASVPQGASADHYIFTNGALSDKGVKKVYPPVAPASFTYPVGIADKYTPVSHTVDYTAPGSIIVAPVNTKVPSVTNLLDDELHYFWNVVSEDFDGLVSISHSYTYLPDDILGIAETDADFVGGRYHNYLWTDLGHGGINTAGHRIDIANASFIDGDYTCGYYTNFLNKPILYSRIGAANIGTTGAAWENAASWTTDPSHSGPAYTEAPSGNPIVVMQGHRINVTTDFRAAYSVVDSGVVAVGTTIGHNFGKISGNGRIITQNIPGGSLIVPGGNYEGFVNTPDATIEYNCVNAPGGQTLPSLEEYPDVDFTGDQQIDLTVIDITVKGNVIISCPTLNNAVFDKDITVYKDWTNTNSSAGSWIPGRSTVRFADSSVSNLYAGATEEFYNLEMDRDGNSFDLILNAPVDVTNKLILNTANIVSDNTNILSLTSTATTAVTGGSSNSFVDGPLRKNILNTSKFRFPVGKGDRYGYMDLFDVRESVSPSYWKVEYFDQNPQVVYTNAMNAPLTSISDNESWKVVGPGAVASNNAKVRLRWDDKSYPDVTADAVARKYLRVVEYGSGVWDERGKEFYPNNFTPEMVATGNNVTDDAYVFTLGIAGVTATLTDASATDVCNDGTVTSMPVEFTGEPDFSLQYRVTNIATAAYLDFTMTGISGTVAQISVSGADIEPILNTAATTDLRVSLLTVADGNNKAGVCFGATEFSVLLTYTPKIAGSFEVGTGETRSYTADLHAGATYSWSWDGASGGTIASPAVNTTDIQFNTVISPKYFDLQITETVTATGCAMSDVQTITLNHVPVPEILPDDLNICEGETVTYSTVYNAGHEYRWIVTGGNCTGCGAWNSGAGSNQITVDWNTSGNGSIELTESTDASHSVIGTDINSLLISSSISAYNVTADDSFLCIGDATNINLSNSQLDVDYDIRNADTDALIATATGTGSALAVATGAISATTTYYVLAYNQGCETVQNGTPVVTIADDFYAKANSDANLLTNWGTNTDGSGNNPLSFAIAGTKLHVENNAYLSANLSLGTDVILYNNFGSVLNADTYHLTADSIENTNGTVQFSGPANGFAISTGTVEYNGGVQNVAGGVYFNLKINGAGQKHLVDEAWVNGELSMLNGSLRTVKPKILTLTETATVAVPANPTSFVDGPMAHTVATASPVSKIFPVGADGLLRRIDITVQHTDATPTTYTANYLRSSAQGLHILPVAANLSHVSSVGYWHIDKSNELVSLDGSTDANLVSATATLFYVADDYVTQPASLRVAKSNDVLGLWENRGGSVDLAAKSVTTGVFRTFCDLCLANDENGANPLPITLLQFSATADAQDVLLSWQTSSEVNNDYFTLERSYDARSFVAIAEIEGAGTTSALNAYNYTDENQPAGIVYYRLKQTDFDGTASYSNVVKVYVLERESALTDFLIFPNPSSMSAITMRVSADEEKQVKLDVVNVFGQVVYSGSIELVQGVSEYSLQNIFVLEKGKYFIIINNDIATQKMFIIK